VLGWHAARLAGRAAGHAPLRDSSVRRTLEGWPQKLDCCERRVADGRRSGSAPRAPVAASAPGHSRGPAGGRLPLMAPPAEPPRRRDPLKALVHKQQVRVAPASGLRPAAPLRPACKRKPGAVNRPSSPADRREPAVEAPLHALELKQLATRQRLTQLSWVDRRAPPGCRDALRAHASHFASCRSCSRCSATSGGRRVPPLPV
jgi:hypothetical protein